MLATRHFAAATALAVGLLTGCERTYSTQTPPTEALSKFPDRHTGERFPAMGEPKLQGVISEKHFRADAGGFAPMEYQTHKFHYDIGGVQVLSESKLPDNCTGVRGIWRETDPSERYVNPKLPAYALIVEDVITKPE